MYKYIPSGELGEIEESRVVVTGHEPEWIFHAKSGGKWYCWTSELERVDEQ